MSTNLRNYTKVLIEMKLIDRDGSLIGPNKYMKISNYNVPIVPKLLHFQVESKSLGVFLMS